MAKAKEEVVKENVDRKKELVPYRAFKDSNKYKDDLVVSVNGKTWVIQRGVTVMIPRFVRNVLERSQFQDEQTSYFIEEQENYAKTRKELQ